MDRRSPVNRRLERSSRVTAAVVLLVVASAGVVGAVWTRDRLMLGAACAVAVACGWAALRLTWTTVLQTRYENATDRTELAKAYQELFAARTVEHQGFVSDMSARLAARDRLVHRLQGSMVAVEMRAIEAETSVLRFQARLDDAEGRLVSLEEYLASTRVAADATREELETTRREREEARAQAELHAQALREYAGPEPLRSRVVPEWADLESDPTAALLAWEQHASALSGSLSGRHSADAQRRAGGA